MDPLPAQEPRIAVGLRENADRVRFAASGECLLNGQALAAGPYEAVAQAGGLVLLREERPVAAAPERLRLVPAPQQHAVFTVMGIPIGRSFHWERLQQQTFQGELVLEQAGPGTLRLINAIPLEQYLESVISSEMSPRSPAEFLKAHCIISRSWLLAQIRKKSAAAERRTAAADRSWTDAAAHREFDVCADDHCQRYHGIGRVNQAARQALVDTRGEVLVFDGEICDTRFSKCCGGISESFATAWEDREVPYLRPVADCPPHAREFVPPLAEESMAARFISAVPRAYCNVGDRTLLEQILPDFDFETQHFFRWEVVLQQEALQQMLSLKTGIDFGAIRALVPLARGASGRIYSLKVCGTKAEKVFGKELAIRRILSPSHLYSSAFTVAAPEGRHGVPEQFTLRGAGWGHGVGLCQIGAAAMAARGIRYADILNHYFTGALLRKLY